VVERPRGGPRFFETQNFGLVVKTWLNWRLGGALRWKGEANGWEGLGVVRGKLAPPRLLPPPVSVMDRWVGPREQVLNIPIAGDMGSVSLVACY
jgi:hypothetical protein